MEMNPYFSALFTAEDLADWLSLPHMTFHQYVWNYGVAAPWAIAMAPGKGGDKRGHPNYVRFWDMKGALEWARFVIAHPCTTSGEFAPQTPSTIPCVTLTTIHYIGKVTGLSRPKMYDMANRGLFPTPAKTVVKDGGRVYRYYTANDTMQIVRIMRGLG